MFIELRSRTSFFASVPHTRLALPSSGSPRLGFPAFLGTTARSAYSTPSRLASFPSVGSTTLVTLSHRLLSPGLVTFPPPSMGGHGQPWLRSTRPGEDEDPGGNTMTDYERENFGHCFASACLPIR